MTEPLIPDSYGQFLADLKGRIRAAQLRASMAVNRELVLLYWRLGRDILDRQHRENWGAKVIDRLAGDLKRAFPEMKGFSPRNLKYMRAFAEAWPDEAIVQAVLAQFTWYHNLAILEKLSDPEDRIWYAKATIQHGWSRSVLVHQMNPGGCTARGKPSPTSTALCPRHNPTSRGTSPKIPTTSIFSPSATMRTSAIWSVACSSTCASFFSNSASGSHLWAASTRSPWAATALGAWDRHDIRAPLQQLGKRDLPWLYVFGRGDIEYLRRRLHIGVVILALIPWIGSPEITLRVLLRSLDLAGHKTPAERRKRHEADAELAQNRDYLRFQIPFPQRILALQHGNRMNGMGAPDVFDAGLRETEEPYFTPLPPGPIALKKSIGIVDYPFTIIVK